MFFNRTQPQPQPRPTKDWISPGLSVVMAAMTLLGGFGTQVANFVRQEAATTYLKEALAEQRQLLKDVNEKIYPRSEAENALQQRDRLYDTQLQSIQTRLTQIEK